MCKKFFNTFTVTIFLFVPALTANAQEKEVYIPKEVLAQDFENPQSQWCRQRMKLTKHFTILWDKGFGNDPATAPDLNGKSMKCDLDTFSKIADGIFEKYRYKIGGANCDRYRMPIFLMYNDDIMDLGCSRDSIIGAVWQMNPYHIRRVPNILAYEMKHCFQQQIGCDTTNVNNNHDYYNDKPRIGEKMIIEAYDDKRDDEVFEELDEMPTFKGGDVTSELIDASTGEKIKQVRTFPGGQQGLIQYLTSMIHYPGDAIMGNIQGRVLVNFVVEATGEISNVKVARSAHPSLDKEALRLVEGMPAWNPGMLNGKPVRVKYTLPITFRL